MRLKRFQLNSVFEYINDIRRYTYDLESYIKSNISNNLKILPTPPVPDEIEPELPRFICRIENKDNNIIIELSQVRLSIICEYKVQLDTIELNNFIKITDNIKSLLFEKIQTLNIAYEGLVFIAENIYANPTDITLLSVDSEIDEKREKETKIFNSDYFITTEKICFKAYNQDSSIRSLSKNVEDLFVGYVVTYAREINNREYFNRNKEVIHNQIDIRKIEEKLFEESLLWK